MAGIRPGLKPQGYKATQAKARFRGHGLVAPSIYGGGVAYA